jgi:hypothetical protein
MDVANGRGGVACELRRRIDLSWIRHVDQVMRDTAAVLRGYLVGADIESAIHRSRIAVDDLPVMALGQREAQRALARRRRTEDGKYEWLHAY